MRAHTQPHQCGYIFLADGQSAEQRLTYGELDLQARAIASALQAFGATGERALLLYPPGLAYIAAFFGCLYAGVVAVPAYPPLPARWARDQRRILSIAHDAQPQVVLTLSSLLPSTCRQKSIGGLSAASPITSAESTDDQLAVRSTRLTDLFAPAASTLPLRWLATDTVTADQAETWQTPMVQSHTLALLQYTSGSTAAPKGVMLSHSNLLHNSALIQRGFNHTTESRGVIWLPPYHDMGLIGGVLQPLYAAFPVTLMSPMVMLQHPIRWLAAITRYQATTSGGPNFAYDLCLRRITLAQRDTLDLRSWRVAFNGAEPIRCETLERFASFFAPCGFRREAWYPCYGLAEATLMVSGSLKAARPTIVNVSSAALAQNRVCTVTGQNGAQRSLVGCGQNLTEQRLLIVDPQTLTPCGPTQVGEIWVAGPSVAQGYWNRPQETRDTFAATLADTGEGPFLRTGDVGFMQDEEVFITGRSKDLVIIAGRNHYPQDIEWTVERSHPAIRPSGCAAFAIDVVGHEHVVVVAEMQRTSQTTVLADSHVPSTTPVRAVPLLASGVVQAIRQAIAREHDLQVYAVSLLKAGSLPKTSSGKIQRHACCARFLTGTLNTLFTWTMGLPIPRRTG